MKEFDFDAMTDKELDELENSIFLYKRERRERNIRKSVDAIINCIETEIKKCPALRDTTAIITDNDEYMDWSEVLSMMKNME